MEDIECYLDVFSKRNNYFSKISFQLLSENPEYNYTHIVSVLEPVVKHWNVMVMEIVLGITFSNTTK